MSQMISTQEDTRRFALDKALDYMLWTKQENAELPSAEDIVEMAKKYEAFLSG